MNILIGTRFATLLLVLTILVAGCSGDAAEDAPDRDVAEPAGSAEANSPSPRVSETNSPQPEASDASEPADSLARLAAAAEGQGPVVWYESTPTEEIQGVVDAFMERFPGVGLEHVRLEGGSGVAARIVQERQANAPTADVGTSGPDTILELTDREALETLSAEDLGISEQLLPDPTALATAVSTYVALYNTDAISSEDAPSEWEDLVDPRWQGQLGTWAIAAGQANLASAWGEERTTELVEQMAALQPRLYSSTFPLAADVGSGELPVALGIYHTAQPPIEAGAPLEISLLDPTPVSTIYSGLVEGSPNLDAAKLFLAWLHSDEGNQAYEEATGRGSPFLDTQTAELLADRELAEWPISERTTLERLLDEYSTLLEQGGSVVDSE